MIGLRFALSLRMGHLWQLILLWGVVIGLGGTAATAALGAGLSRTELSTYVPAFMTAGVLCIVAAGLTLWLAPLRTHV